MALYRLVEFYMVETLKNRNFSLLWFAGLISMMGTWMLFAALPFHVYTVTGSALATSGWLIAMILPGVLFGSVAGVFVDRWDRRRTMIAVNLLRTAVIPLLLLVQSPEWIWIVYVVAFIESTLGQFFGPAENALLPTLVGKEHLVSANSLNALNDNLARILGPAAGGLLLGIWGLQGVVIADTLSYLLSAMLIMLIVVPEKLPSVDAAAVVGAARTKIAAFGQEWIMGLKLIVQDPLLSRIFLVQGIALFGDAILSAILVVFVQNDLDMTAAQFGSLLTVRGVGGVLGGLLIAQIGQKLSGRQLFSGGLTLTGVLVVMVLLKPPLYGIFLLVGLAGIPAIAWMVANQTLVQQATEDGYRGRVFGALGTTMMLLMLMGSGLAGLLADQIGAMLLIFAAGLIYILSGVLASIVLPRASRAIAGADIGAGA
jgi:predicted MFS family arabinose efflux permease